MEEGVSMGTFTKRPQTAGGVCCCLVANRHSRKPRSHVDAACRAADGEPGARRKPRRPAAHLAAARRLAAQGRAGPIACVTGARIGRVSRNWRGGGAPAAVGRELTHPAPRAA